MQFYMRIVLSEERLQIAFKKERTTLCDIIVEVDSGIETDRLKV